MADGLPGRLLMGSLVVLVRVVAGVPACGFVAGRVASFGGWHVGPSRAPSWRMGLNVDEGLNFALYVRDGCGLEVDDGRLPGHWAGGREGTPGCRPDGSQGGHRRGGAHG